MRKKAAVISMHVDDLKEGCVHPKISVDGDGRHETVDSWFVDGGFITHCSTKISRPLMMDVALSHCHWPRHCDHVH